MNEEVDLSSLKEAETPELVGPAFKRFRRAIGVITGLAILFTFMLSGVGAFLFFRYRQPSDVQALERLGAEGPFHVLSSGKLGKTHWTIYAWVDNQGHPCYSSAGTLRVGISGCFPYEEVDTPGRVVNESFSSGTYSGPDGQLFYSAIVGAAPQEIRRVRVLRASARPVEVKTKKISGINLRLFAVVSPFNFRGEYEIEAYDAAGKLVLPRPFPDARASGRLSAEETRAAEAALATGGDPNATVRFVDGPDAYGAALARVANGLNPPLTADRSVWTVGLFGTFSWPGFQPSGHPSLARFLVDVKSGEVLFAVSDDLIPNPDEDLQKRPAPKLSRRP